MPRLAHSRRAAGLSEAVTKLQAEFLGSWPAEMEYSFSEHFRDSVIERIKVTDEGNRVMRGYREAILKMYNGRKSYDTEEGTQHPRIAQELVDGSPLKIGDSVLDAATGTGLVAFIAAEVVGQAGSITAIDISEGLLAQAREKAGHFSGKPVKFVHGDAETVRFADHMFDVVYCCEALVLFQRPLEALKFWSLALKEKGAIAFTCTHEGSYFGKELKWALEHILGSSTPEQMHEPLGTEERIKDALLSCGFANVRIQSDAGGSYRSLEQVKCSRNFLTLMFKGAPAVERLTDEEVDRVCELFHQSLKELLTDKGVWQERGLYLVHATKG